MAARKVGVISRFKNKIETEMGIWVTSLTICQGESNLRYSNFVKVFWNAVRGTRNCSKKKSVAYLVWKALKYIKHRWKLYDLEILVRRENLHKLQHINNSVKDPSFISVSVGVEPSHIIFGQKCSFVDSMQTGVLVFGSVLTTEPHKNQPTQDIY